MVTARTPFKAPRSRRPAGPLRLLLLAALLFAFLYTHAAGADSASAHVSGGAVVAQPAPISTGDGHHHNGGAFDRDGDGHGDSHPAEECASAHPYQGCALPGPHPDPLARQTPASEDGKPQAWAVTWSSGLPPLLSSLSSVVQQV
ncbi:hypothetical protein ACPCSC_32895 [Streptomyces lavendulocolor]|uniref:hypothetical protein n=1 Tax=Streptomyces lavendulocolor TaxID=67316 RepID=UPI003C2BC701